MVPPAISVHTVVSDVVARLKRRLRSLRNP